jgi:hypothetical protein
MKMSRLIAIPGFVLVAIGSILFSLGMGAELYPISFRPGPSAFLMASFGFIVAIMGVFLILLSGIFKGVLEKRWGHNRNGP